MSTLPPPRSSPTARTSARIGNDSAAAEVAVAQAEPGLTLVTPESTVSDLLGAFERAELARLGPDSPLPRRAAREIARLAREEGWASVSDITPLLAEAAIRRIECSPPITRGRRLRNALRALGRYCAKEPRLAILTPLREFSPAYTVLPVLPTWSSAQLVSACRLARHAETNVIWPRTIGPAHEPVSPQSIGFEALVRLLVLWAVRPYELYALRIAHWASDIGRLTVAPMASAAPRSFLVDDRTAECLRALSNGRPADDLLFRHADGRPWTLKLQNTWMRWLRERLELNGSLRICRRSAILFLAKLLHPGDLSLLTSITGYRLSAGHLVSHLPDEAGLVARQRMLAQAVGRAAKPTA